MSSLSTAPTPVLRVQLDRRCVTSISIMLVVVGLTCLLVAPASAQAPAKERQFVYGANAFTGQRYVGTFYPQTIDTLYLMADVPNIISPRYSLVYFWPTTNEYKVDWDALNETVHGTLEIMQFGRVIRRLSQTQYTIQYPNGLDAGEVYLYLGEEVQTQYEEFERQRQAYRDRVWAFYEATTKFRQQLDAEVASGKPEDEVQVPEPPREPEPFLFFSTGIHDGFPVELPAGKYTIQLRGEDGQIVPSSKKKLVVFTAQRDGVGYTVVSQDKWTIPDEANDPSHVIYARSGSVIYLQPFLEKEYNELYFTHLENPQSTLGSSDRWMWVHTAPRDSGFLEILRHGQVVGRIERKPYLVRQVPGPALGYEVLEYPTDGSVTRAPDFEGYEVRINADQPSFRVRLVDADGQVIAGSEREIRVLYTQRTWPLYVLSVLPLVVGIVLTGWRKKKVSALPKLRIDTQPTTRNSG